jgi:hypothetical protein
MVRTCPIVMNGGSTGFPPIHVNKHHDDTRSQNKIWLSGYSELLINLAFMVNGSLNKINRAIASAITPPSLLGIERRMAYNHRKYHSGLIWTGVTKGLDIMKFSGSVNILGLNITSDEKISRTIE